MELSGAQKTVLRELQGGKTLTLDRRDGKYRVGSVESGSRVVTPATVRGLETEGIVERKEIAGTTITIFELTEKGR